NTLRDWEAFISLLKCIFGTGCLAMPKAYSYVGWLFGLSATLLIGVIVLYTMHVLLHDMNLLRRHYSVSMLSYSETMELAVLNGPAWLRPFRKLLAYYVDFLLCLYHFGVDCVYVIFIAKSLKSVGDMYLSDIDERIYMALLTLPLLAIFLVRSIKYLVPFAIIANMLMFTCFGICMSYMLVELPDLEERDAVLYWTEFPLFFGTIMFAIETLGVIPSLQVNMMTPDHYLGTCGVLNRAMCIVIVLYAIFGFIGYWKYGEETASSVISNLPSDEILPQYVLAMFALAILFSYALQGYVAIEIIWRHYMQPRLLEQGSGTLLEYLLRMATVIASVLCAIALPNFELLLTLVGSLLLAQVGLVFPGVINLCICYTEGYGPYKLLLWRSLLLISVGLGGGISGTLVSL
ncbi:hypothetical protein KR222_008359, partial [Zaprionus bogoriensis]